MEQLLRKLEEVLVRCVIVQHFRCAPFPRLAVGADRWLGLSCTDAVAARVRFPQRRRWIGGEASPFLAVVPYLSPRRAGRNESFLLCCASIVTLTVFCTPQLQSDGLGNFYAQGMDADDEQQDLDQDGDQVGQ